jgi:hypothetical protein
MKGFSFVLLCPTIALAPNGDLHFSSRFEIGDYAVLTFGTSAALDLHVATGDGIKTFTQANFVATVMQRLKSDTKAGLSFELPAQIAAYDTVVQARTVPADKGEARLIKADLKQRDDDTSVLQFSDLLAAGQNTEYTLHLVYQPKDDGAASIGTTIQPLDEETQKLITPLKSTTHFSFRKGEVLPEGTSTVAAHALGDKPVWKEPKPADGK